MVFKTNIKSRKGLPSCIHVCFSAFYCWNASKCIPKQKTKTRAQQSQVQWKTDLYLLHVTLPQSGSVKMINIELSFVQQATTPWFLRTHTDFPPGFLCNWAFLHAKTTEFAHVKCIVVCVLINLICWSFSTWTPSYAKILFKWQLNWSNWMDTG